MTLYDSILTMVNDDLEISEMASSDEDYQLLNKDLEFINDSINKLTNEILLRLIINMK